MTQRGRTANVSRETSETRIHLQLSLDGSGQAETNTGIGFFDHMLQQLACHGLLDLSISCAGDLQVDGHHTVEDAGIALGMAVRQALGDFEGVGRYGYAVVPMDEALVLCAVDVSGRGLCEVDLAVPVESVGGFEVQLVPEFLRAFAANAGCTLHVRMLAGRNGHHIIEAVFKALGRALRMAVEPDSRRSSIPSTKGVI